MCKLTLFLLLTLGFFCSSVQSSYAADIPEPNPELRIISAGGSITELLFALGLGDQIIAVDSSSLYPQEALELPKVGYFRSLGAEGLLSLEPDLIIAAKGAGPKAALEQVARLNVDIKTYDQGIYSISEWKKLVTALGDDYGKAPEAMTLIEKVQSGIDTALASKQDIDKTLNAIALLSIGQRGPVAAGKNTVPDMLFELAGINNVANELDGYKPFSTELLAQKKLDLVLIPSHVIEGLGGQAEICENQILKQAMQNECTVFVMDGLILMGFGSRLDQAVKIIIDQIQVK